MKSVPSQVSCHELRVIATNGRVFRVDVAGAIKISVSRLMVLSMAMFSVMVALFNPPLFGLELPLLGRFFYWLLVCYFVTFLWILQFKGFDLLNRRLKRDVPVFSGLVCLVSVAAMVWSTYAATELLFGVAGITNLQIWGEVLRYFLIAMVIDFFTVAMVLPRFEYVTFENPPPGPAPQNEHVVETVPARTSEPLVLKVNQRSIPLEQICYMKSVEHYVEFHCHADCITERVALRDMVAQAAAANGIQPHRSYWVKREAVQDMARRNGSPVLILQDGTEIPVSRHRRAEVVAWLAA